MFCGVPVIDTFVLLALEKTASDMRTLWGLISGNP